MTLPVNPGPDLPGPTPPVPPVDQPDLPPVEPEQEPEPNPGGLPDNQPETNLDAQSIVDGSNRRLNCALSV